MEIKETGYLKVMGDYSFPEKRIVINPNDGFDLGLMMTEATVLFYYGESPATIERSTASPLYGVVEQKNECKLGTVEVSLKALEKLGSPERIRLHLIPQERYPKLLVAAE